MAEPILIVSNRGPVQFSRNASGERVSKRGGGGLVTALAALAGSHRVTWVASALSDEDAEVAEEGPVADGDLTVQMVVHDREEYDRYYNVFANPTLWFIQHYLWGLSLAPDVDRNIRLAWDAGYVPCNRRMGEAAVAALRAAGEDVPTVMVHDYQLYLVPEVIRAAVPDAVIEHFTHIPWPQPDSWRVLPADIRGAIHRSMLAADLIGLHRHRYVRNFLLSVAEFTDADVDMQDCVVRHDGRTTVVRHYPISVDPDEFARLAESDDVRAEEPKIEALRREKLVLRVDRTDPSKNIVRGFRAFEVFLHDHPEWHGRVSMLALLDPSRQDIPEYAEYVGAVQRAARRVNDRFYTSDDWTAVDLRLSDNFPQAVAAYKQFDVLLVNAIFDGMNLIAKEAPLVNARDGVLILSENAGAHAELGDYAISVNPFDIQEQADAIHEALTMPAGERRRRLQGIRAHVREHDIAAWTQDRLDDLEALRSRAAARA
jgi:trehalose 6-phosphate synthase